MSVMMIDHKIYQAVYSKIINYQYHNVCDAEYSYTFSHLCHHSEQPAKDIVKIWSDLNEESHDTKYKETPGKNKLSEFIDFSYKLPRVNCFQMLKYLQAINYNIEASTLKRELTPAEKLAMETLEKAINDISGAIIGELEGYKTAKWCEI